MPTIEFEAWSPAVMVYAIEQLTRRAGSRLNHVRSVWKKPGMNGTITDMKKGTTRGMERFKVKYALLILVTVWLSMASGYRFDSEAGATQRSEKYEMPKMQ